VHQEFGVLELCYLGTLLLRNYRMLLGTLLLGTLLLRNFVIRNFVPVPFAYSKHIFLFISSYRVGSLLSMRGRHPGVYFIHFCRIIWRLAGIAYV